MTEFIGRDLISINDFTNEEIETVLDLANNMNSAIKKGTRLDICKGMDMATLFYEPSTRTRGSFESAMHKLGGEVISFADAQTTSSAAKGETIADTVRVLESYADILVIRHPWEGAAKIAADYAKVPVINAGDGAHEHPTQTLCDLYMMKETRGKIKGLNVCLKGDLKYGRTVHSLIYALARLGAKVFLWPQARELYMPEEVLNKLHSEYNYVPTKISPDDLKDLMGEVEVLYIAPVKPYTYPLWRDSDRSPSFKITIEEVLGTTDVLYVTRIQTERRNNTDGTKPEESKPTVTREFVGQFKKNPLVMHPLPRMNELPSELDGYPRSVYFQQAAYGVPVRMALTSLLLGASPISAPEGYQSIINKNVYETCKQVFDVKCPNSECVSNKERERRYISPEFKIVDTQPLTLRCAYCEHEAQPKYIASSDWHEGRLDNKKYHSADSHWVRRIKPENLIIFDTEKEAQSRGFKPSSYVSKSRYKHPEEG